MNDFDSTLEHNQTWETRPSFLALENHRSEVLVIGGGINGISIMRDLSLQGVKVTLVDAGDLISGASAASSHSGSASPATVNDIC